MAKIDFSVTEFGTRFFYHPGGENEFFRKALVLTVEQVRAEGKNSRPATVWVEGLGVRHMIGSVCELATLEAPPEAEQLNQSVKEDPQPKGESGSESGSEVDKNDN